MLRAMHHDNQGPATRIVQRWYERTCRGQMSSFPYLSEYAAQQREVQLCRLRDAEHVDLCIAEGARDLHAGQLEPGIGRGILIRGALRPVVLWRFEAGRRRYADQRRDHQRDAASE